MIPNKSLKILLANRSFFPLSRLNGYQQRFISNTRLPITTTKSIDENNYDSYVLVGTDLENDLKKFNLVDKFKKLKSFKELNKSFEKEITFALVNNKRVIYSPTGPLNRDYDDVRRIADATKAGINKAIKVGSQKPLLINLAKNSFEMADQVSMLAALDAAQMPLQTREFKMKSELLNIDELGHYDSGNEASKTSALMKIVNAIELGRIVARDIGDGDPERMTPEKTLEYVRKAFESENSIKLSVIEGHENFKKDYPLFAAVNRASNSVPRHQGRIIKLFYEPEDGKVDTTLFLVGKGVTYDTGGADIKTGGHMQGMNRDKCGAAFVAGFFKTLALLKPKGLKVYGTMCLVRNSVGEECYVADEVLVSRSKKRILVGNTDAEGRLAMADLLCEAKEMAVNEVNPQLFTIATLTGHVIVCYGGNYSSIMSNGPASKMAVDKNLFSSGEKIGDPYEISLLRKEDYKKHTSVNPNYDILQIGSGATGSHRSHQGAGAFLVMASGLEKHGKDSEKPLPYSHIDIAGSSGYKTENPTGSPLPSFVCDYILPRI